MKQPFEFVKDQVCLITVPDPENWWWEEVWEGCGVYHATEKTEK